MNELYLLKRIEALEKRVLELEQANKITRPVKSLTLSEAELLQEFSLDKFTLSFEAERRFMPVIDLALEKIRALPQVISIEKTGTIYRVKKYE